MEFLRTPKFEGENRLHRPKWLTAARTRCIVIYLNSFFMRIFVTSMCWGLQNARISHWEILDPKHRTIGAVLLFPKRVRLPACHETLKFEIVTWRYQLRSCLGCIWTYHRLVDNNSFLMVSDATGGVGSIQTLNFRASSSEVQADEQLAIMS